MRLERNSGAVDMYPSTKALYSSQTYHTHSYSTGSSNTTPSMLSRHGNLGRQHLVRFLIDFYWQLTYAMSVLSCIVFWNFGLGQTVCLNCSGCYDIVGLVSLDLVKALVIVFHYLVQIVKHYPSVLFHTDFKYLIRCLFLSSLLV